MTTACRKAPDPSDPVRQRNETSGDIRHRSELLYGFVRFAETFAQGKPHEQKADDADFYVMSEIDAKLREMRLKVLEQKKD